MPWPADSRAGQKAVPFGLRAWLRQTAIPCRSKRVSCDVSPPGRAFLGAIRRQNPASVRNTASVPHPFPRFLRDMGGSERRRRSAGSTVRPRPENCRIARPTCESCFRSGHGANALQDTGRLCIHRNPLGVQHPISGSRSAVRQAGIYAIQLMFLFTRRPQYRSGPRG